MSSEPKLIPLRIRLPYQTEAEFIEKYGSNVARGGVFIATRALKPEGTPLAFEFVLADGSRLIRGDGVVVKTQVDQGGSRAGMTLRFVRLDAPSKAVIDRLIAQRSGLEPQPPEHVIAAVPAVATPPPPPLGATAPATTPPGLRPLKKVAPVAAATEVRSAPLRPEPVGVAVPPAAAATTRHAAETPANVTEPKHPHQASGETGHPERERETGETSVRLEARTSPALPEGTATAAAPEAQAVGSSARPQDPTALAIATESAPAPGAEAEGQPRLARSEVPAEPAPVPPPSALRAPHPEAAARTAEVTRADAATPPAEARTRRRPRSVEIPAQAEAKAVGPEIVLGIDLGTTNARVAVYRDGTAKLIPLTADGRTAIPSCIALDEAGQMVVGDAARERMAHGPKEAVIAAKRLIGQRARSRKLREQAARVPFELVADAVGDAGVRLGDRVRSLSELSATLLASLKASAEGHLGHPVTRAVLCVPAYFTDHQRAAMREAGRMAGLEVVRIFNEPSAVALAFGYGKALPRKRLLVYDLGGGTFDATVVEVTGDELEVVANGGDNFLGGMDFDARIFDALASRFAEAEKTPLDASPIATLRLREAAEKAKIALSDREDTEVHVAGAAVRADGTTVDLQLPLSRGAVESLTSELVERTLAVTRDVLASAQLSAQSLDEILLVGGQSRAPLVRRKVEELVGRPVRTDVDAQAAVALGAAILGHALLQTAKGKPGVALSEVLSAPIGIGTRGGGMRRVLERNTRLPAEKTILVPVKAGETVGIGVFQGTAERVEDNDYLGALNTVAEKAGELAVRFYVGPDGTLDLTAIGPGGRGAKITLTTEDASDEVHAALLAQAPLPGEADAAPKGLLGGFKKLFGRR